MQFSSETHVTHIDAVITAACWLLWHLSNNTVLTRSLDTPTIGGAQQVMLEEAVAIVMSPRDSKNRRCGMFRLTTPGGMDLIKDCRQTGFHTHPPTATGQKIYELCGHVRFCLAIITLAPCACRTATCCCMTCTCVRNAGCRMGQVMYRM